MIQVLGKLANKSSFVFVACSGGVDSMAVCSFYNNMSIPYRPVFFNHGTETSKKAEKFLRGKFANPLIGNIRGQKGKGESHEEFWRNERYNYLKSLKYPVVTGHQLDDCVETWIWSSMHGIPKLPEYYNGTVYRPFLLNRKEKFVEWCKRRGVSWIEDESNKDTRFMRNLIRHELMPNILKVNPGIHKVIKKKLLERYSN